MSWEYIDKMAREAAKRLGLPVKPFNDINHPCSHFASDMAYTNMQLRTKVNDLELENFRLKSFIKDDERARKENPAVQEAWDQYQIVKKLVKD